MRHGAIAIPAALLLAASVACSPEPPVYAEPRLVVLYATCSLNKQFLSPYDATVRYTPNLAAFGEGALVFARHQTESGQSGVAFASLFSGSPAYHHGVYSHPRELTPDVKLITEAYAEAGWDVHTWLRHPMASAKLGYAQGVRRENVHGGVLTADSGPLQPILDRLAADPTYRALLVTGFTVTHGPYRTDFLRKFCERYPGECQAPGEEVDFRRMVALYRKNHRRWSFDFSRTIEKLGVGEAEVAQFRSAVEILYKSNVFHLDRMFGALLERIADRGLSEESLIAFTSDHGEILFRENAPFHWTHGFQLAPEVLGVALILSGPGAGVPPGAYRPVTRSIDVFPTLAGLSGVEPPSCDGCGRDLSAAVRGLAEPAPIVAYSHTALFEPRLWRRYRRFSELVTLFPRNVPEFMWVAARDGDDFFEHRRTPEGRWETVQFDLASDLGEETNRFDRKDERHAAMEARLQAYKTRLIRGYRNRRGAVSPEEQERRLRSLGYIQ